MEHILTSRMNDLSGQDAKPENRELFKKAHQIGKIR